ncbi:MAG TPA: hypothetical protein VJ717_05055 [Gemmatimonadaceae bacterium]|nr:hypothetical protein [Gemmatimonadaceae bacterium]
MTANTVGVIGRHAILGAVLIGALRCHSQLFMAGASHQASDSDHNVNSVIHWNEIASEMMLEVGPVMDSRAQAILHTAIHDAVNAIERRYEPYTFNERAPAGANIDAAVASAAREVLLALVPGQRERTEREYAATLGALPNAGKEEGVMVGRQAAKANLDRRAADGVPAGRWPPQSGSITQPVYVPTGKPGDYAFTPPFDKAPMGPLALFPGWGALRPFAVDIKKYTLHGPDPLTSAAYARDLDSMKALGGLTSALRTKDQTEIAFFWFEPFENWNEIARNAIAARGSDVWESARICALAYLAVADAAIAVFEAKYRYRFWRPFTAIRRAHEDANPATQPDEEWLPLLWPTSNTSPFLIPPIPDYPSAAATLSAAAAEVLKNTIGDSASFVVSSRFLPGVTRRFTTFSQAAHEAAMSRFFGGIHFLRAVRDGEALGKQIGGDVSRLLPPVGKATSQRADDL